MTNEEKIKQYYDYSKRSQELLKQGNLEERNKLCISIRELYKGIDWGLTEGDKVLLKESGNRKVKAVVAEHLKNNYFFVRKLSGGEVIVPGGLLIKADFETEVNS